MKDSIMQGSDLCFLWNLQSSLQQSDGLWLWIDQVIHFSDPIGKMTVLNLDL